MAKSLNHPTLEQLRSALRNRDPFGVIIRGHQGIEALLLHAICEVLTVPHSSLRRIAFLAKVDLAVALHLMGQASRPLAAYLNATRNRFAHEFGADFAARHAAELLSTYTPLHHRISSNLDPAKMSPSELLAHSCALLYVEIDAFLTNIQERQVANSVLREMVDELLAKVPKPTDTAFDRELRRRVAKRLGKALPADNPPPDS